MYCSNLTNRLKLGKYNFVGQPIMDIKKIVIIAAILLLALIGFNYYSSAQSEKARAVRVAETDALRASIPQPVVQQPAVIKESDANQLESTTVEPVPVAADKEVFSASIPEDIESKSKVDDSVCDSIIPVAEKIMRGRLNGVSIASSLEVVNSIKDGTPANEAVSNLTKQIVIQAYDLPSFSTESYKDDAIREFGAKQYLACMKAFN